MIAKKVLNKGDKLKRTIKNEKKSSGGSSSGAARR
jgi:hypothetical protein